MRVHVVSNGDQSFWRRTWKYFSVCTQSSTFGKLSNLVGVDASSTSSPLLSSTLVTSTSNTGEQVQGIQTGDSSNNSNENQIREFTKGGALGANRKILPGPPPERLVAITNNMNSHLTSLLAIFKERDEERERLRRELQRSQEQVHALLSQSAASHRASSGNLSSAAISATISDDQNNIANQAATSSQESRPLSYISVEESSGPEMSEKNPESEDDVH
jgi:hypothetical protein